MVEEVGTATDCAEYVRRPLPLRVLRAPHGHRADRGSAMRRGRADVHGSPVRAGLCACLRRNALTGGGVVARATRRRADVGRRHVDAGPRAGAFCGFRWTNSTRSRSSRATSRARTSRRTSSFSRSLRLQARRSVGICGRAQTACSRTSTRAPGSCGRTRTTRGRDTQECHGDVGGTCGEGTRLREVVAWRPAGLYARLMFMPAGVAGVFVVPIGFDMPCTLLVSNVNGGLS